MKLVTNEITSLLIDHAARHGGFTIKYDSLEHVAFETGYMVALPGMEQKLKFNLPAMIEGAMDVLKALQRQCQLRIHCSNLYIGGWISESGILYLDVSEHFDCLDEATLIGKRRDQLAIYDCTNSDVTLLFEWPSLYIYHDHPRRQSMPKYHNQNDGRNLETEGQEWKEKGKKKSTSISRNI